MSEQLTPEWLAEKRRVAEAATPGPWIMEVDEDGLSCTIVAQSKSLLAEALTFTERGPVVSLTRQKIDVAIFALDEPFEEINANLEFVSTFDPTTVLAMLDEIERLRREREMLAAGLIDSEECVKVLLDLFPDDVRPGVAGVVDRMGRRRRTALALLDGEKGGASA